MPSHMEDQPIMIPLLEDGVVAIGDLWNCNEGKPLGLNLFGQELEAQHLAAYPRATQDYTLNHLKDTKDNVKNLYVKAEVTLDILNGMIHVEGGCTYDDKNEHKFNEEKLECKYRLETFNIRALPSAKERIDKYTKDQIISGKLKATHVCMEVVAGAETTANIFVKQKTNVDNRDIFGYFRGSLKVGPISASASAELKMLDTDNNSGLEKRITVTSKPPLKSNPKTVEEMFSALEAIPQRVSEENHFQMITSRKVVGVPLRFKLVPLNQFIDIETEKKFKIMADDVMDSFMDMVVTLKDFQKIDHLKRLIVQKDRRLQTLLEDADNPWTKEITEEEMRLQKISKDIQVKAFTGFEQYKNGKAKDQDLLNIVMEYKETFEISKILSQTQQYCSRGKQLMTGVQLSDLDSEAEISFFSNETDLSEWFSGERRIKLLVQTNGDTPHGALLFLYDNSAHLKKLGIDVGVAYPNISKGFTMTLKVRDRQKIYDREDIPYALQVLATAVGKADPVSNTFYTVCGALTGIQLPLQKDSLSDLTSLIATLKELKNVFICSSYLQLIERLTEKDNKIKFVLSMDALDSLVDSVHFYQRLRKKFEKTNKDIEWIVGTFSLQKFYQAPLLFVFHHGNLVSVCLDNLDLQILLEKLEGDLKTNSSDDINIEILSPKEVTKGCLYPSRCNYGIQVAEILGQSSRSLTDASIKLRSFPDQDNPELIKAIKFNRAALSNHPIEIVSLVTSICTELFSDLTSTLQKHGWNATTNMFTSELSREKWMGVVKSLREFFSKYSPFFAKVEYAISKLKEMSKTFETPQENPTNVKVDPQPFIKTILDDAECGEELKKALSSYNGTSLDVMVNGVTTALQNYADNTEKHFKDPKFFYLRTLIGLVDKITDSNEALISSVNEVAREFIGKIEFPKDKYPGVFEKLTDYLNRKSLYQTVSLLSKCQFDSRIFKVHQTLHNLQPFSEVEVSKQINSSFIESLARSGMEEDQYVELWSNRKFQHLMLKNIHIPSFIEAIKIYQCNNKGKYLLPDFLPKEFQAVIKPLLVENVSNDFDWERKWEKTDDVLQVLQAIAARELIPDDFQEVLRKNLEEKTDLLTALQEAKILYAWDEQGKYFIEPWDIHTVFTAIDLLMIWMQNEEEKDVEISKLVIKSERNFNAPEIYVPDISLEDNWGALGTIEKTVTYNEYSKLSEHLEKPSIEPDELYELLPKGIPYILQNLRMGNSSVIQTENLNSLVEGSQTNRRPRFQGLRFESIDGDTKNQAQTKKSARLTRSDLLTLLSGITDGHVLHDILSKLMTGYFGTLPLIVPVVNNDELQNLFENDPSQGFAYKLLYPILQNLAVHWKAQQGALVSHLLFSEQKFKLVVAVRSMGKNAVGKSTILNQLFDSTCQNMFSSVQEPGAELGRPLVTGGLVEFTWLTPSTCSPKVWNFLKENHYKTGNEELLLLANLHGDANLYPQIVRELQKFGARFLMFLMPCELEDMKLRVRAFQDICSSTNENIFRFLIDPRPHCAVGVEASQIIKASEIGQEAMVDKLQTALLELYSIKIKPWKPNPKTVEKPVVLATSFISPECTKIVTYIQKKSVRTIKNCLKLQKLDLSHKEDLNNALKRNADLISIINQFSSVLLLPENYRRGALLCLTETLNSLSDDTTSKLKSQIKQMKSELKAERDTDRIADLKYQIRELKKTTDERSLNFTDIWREFTAVLKLNDAQPKQQTKEESDEWTSLELCFQLLTYFIDGGCTEMFNYVGVSDPLKTDWLKKILSSNFDGQYNELQKISEINSLRIFVVSIIGLESSGKSTILNHLFGTKFPVGVGGCSTGLKMSLVHLDENLVEELNADAVLIVDSEGIDPLANGDVQKLQKSLLALAISLSNLTLINIQEESLNELANSLETALIRILRLGTKGISTDFVLLHHGVQDPSSSSIPEDFQSLMNKLQTIERNALPVGLRVKASERFQNVNHRLRISEALHNIRKYQTTNDGPVTPEFLEDIGTLYEKILKICKESDGINTFEEWYKNFESLSQEITSDTFPLDFSDLQEMQDHFDLERKIDEIKDAIDIAFWKHKIILKGIDPASNDTTLKDVAIEELKIKLKQIGFTCPNSALATDGAVQTQCEHCQRVVNLRETLLKELQGSIHLYRVQKQLNTYTHLVRNTIFNTELQSFRVKEIKAKNLPKEKKVVSNDVKVIPSGRLIRAEFEYVYGNLPHIISSNLDDPELPVLTGIKAFDMPTEHVGLAARKKAQLTWEQEDIIQAKIKDLPGAMLQEKTAEIYQIGMVRELQAKVSEILSEFELQTKNKLIPEFLWTTHLYGMKYFYKFMNDKQKAWDAKNNPLMLT